MSSNGNARHKSLKWGLGVFGFVLFFFFLWSPVISWPYCSGPLNAKSLWRVAPDFCLLLSLRHHLMALRFLSSPECINFPASNLCSCVGILNRPKSLSNINIYFFSPLYRQLSSYQFFMPQERLPLSTRAHRLTHSSLISSHTISKSHQLFLLKVPNPRYHFLWHPWTPRQRLASSPACIASCTFQKCTPQPTSCLPRVLNIRNQAWLSYSKFSRPPYILRIRAKYSQLPIMSWHPRASHPAPQFRLHTVSTYYASAVLAHLFHRTTCTSLLGAFVLCCRTLQGWVPPLERITHSRPK